MISKSSKNMNTFLTFILVSCQGIIFTMGENKLFETIIQNTMECVAQAPEGFSVETCQEMVHPGNDNSLAKYDQCKCVGLCSAKRMQLLNETGEYNVEKLREYVASMRSYAWLEEMDHVVDKCKDIKSTGNECEYAFQWMTCGLNNSKLALELFRTKWSSAERNPKQVVRKQSPLNTSIYGR